MEAHQGTAKPDWQALPPLHNSAGLPSFAWRGFGLVVRVNQGFPLCHSRGSLPPPPLLPSPTTTTLSPLTEAPFPTRARQWNPLSGSRLKEEFAPTLPPGMAFFVGVGVAQGWPFWGLHLHRDWPPFHCLVPPIKAALITEMIPPLPLLLQRTPLHPPHHTPRLSLPLHRGALLVSYPIRLREWRGEEPAEPTTSTHSAGSKYHFQLQMSFHRLGLFIYFIIFLHRFFFFFWSMKQIKNDSCVWAYSGCVW